jgi:hypothetical protein
LNFARCVLLAGPMADAPSAADPAPGMCDL